jgi:hypothetical protein
MAIANGGLYDLCRPEIDSQVMGEFAQNGIEKHFFLLSALPSVSIRSVKSLKHIMSGNPPPSLIKGEISG